MKNKQVKQMILPIFEGILESKGLLDGPVGKKSRYLRWCEYDGMLKVYQHWEEPRSILEGVVSELDGGFELGVASLTGKQLNE